MSKPILSVVPPTDDDERWARDERLAEIDAWINDLGGETPVERRRRELIEQSRAKDTQRLRQMVTPQEKLTRDREAFYLADREAKRRVNAKEHAALTPPAPVLLTDLLAEPDEEVQFRIEDLWPVGGHAVLSAPMKSGKTTLTGNLARSLVDGDDFLDYFPVEPVGKVVVIDDEMNREQIKRWLRAQGIAHTDRVEVVSLRGKVATFDLLDPARRAEWAKVLRGADVVILDCLRPILDALGLSEDKEAGRFLVQLDAVLEAAGVPEVLVVHHTGHNTGRARGDSRIRDWPDVELGIWRDTDDEDSARFFRAFGRDAYVPEGRLEYDPVTRHLKFVPGENRKNSFSDDVMRRILEYVRDHDGCSGNAIAEAIGGNKKATTDSVKTLRMDEADDESGYLVWRQGPKRAMLHSLTRKGEEWLAGHVVGGRMVVSA